MAGAAPTSDSLEWGFLRKLISNAARATAEGASVIARFSEYGDQVTQGLTAKQHKLADEGSYYVCRSPTPGTGLATIAAPTAVVDTSPFILITNGNAAGGQNIIPDYIKLICTAAGTGGTSLNVTTKLDVIPRYSSGGAGGSNTGLATILGGPWSTNTSRLGGSNALIFAGALVAVAASQQRTIMSTRLRSAIPVVNDEYFLNFGDSSPMLDGVLVSGAAIAQRVVPHPPTVIAPGHTLAVHLWLPAQSVAGSYEVEIGYIER